MMHDFYTAYYNAVGHSRAHAVFCEYAYGKDMCQHGFMTMEALEFLLCVTNLAPRDRLLDVGCGNGEIDHYITCATGAEVYGLDYIPGAIEHAAGQQGGGPSNFFVADLNRLPCAPKSFSMVLSIDTLYFSTNYQETLTQWASCIGARGQLAIFYSHGANPEQPGATFDRTTLPADKTPLGVALTELGIKFSAWDFTKDDYALAVRKKTILEKLEHEFAREGNSSLFKNRIGEALGVMDAFESGMHARYLYYARIQ